MKKYLVLLFISLFFLFPPKTLATDYYVATTGDDCLTCGTQASPFKTIQKAVSLLEGKTGKNSIIVGEGVYDEYVRLNSSGASDDQRLSVIAEGDVTIRSFYSYTLGNFILFKGFTVSAKDCDSSEASILVRGKNNIIEDNVVTNSTRTGINLSPDSADNIVRRNKVNQVYNNGLVIGGKNQTIENNEIANVIDHIDNCSNKPDEDVNGIEFTGTGHVFRSNYIHDLLVESQDGSPHMDAFQTYGQPLVWGGSGRNTIIERNHIFMGKVSTGVLNQSTATISSSGFMLEGEEGNYSNKAENLTIRNNIIEAHTGINIGGGQNVWGLKIYNNTFKGDLDFIYNSWPLAINLYGDVHDFEIFNNIIVEYPTKASHVHIHDIANNGTFGNNLFWNSDGSDPKVYGYTFQPSDIKLNPQFRGEADFHLREVSPAIDKGKASLVTNDYDGLSRPWGSAIDIGAFEYTGVSGEDVTGDVNGDGVVDMVDIGIILKNYGVSPVTDAGMDLNNDNKVNIIDVAMVIKNCVL